MGGTVSPGRCSNLSRAVFYFNSNQKPSSFDSATSQHWGADTGQDDNVVREAVVPFLLAGYPWRFRGHQITGNPS